MKNSYKNTMHERAGDGAPQQLEGWLYYQGRDASGESDLQHPEATDVQQLAQLAQGRLH